MSFVKGWSARFESTSTRIGTIGELFTFIESASCSDSFMLVMLLFGVFLMFAQTSSIAAFIYTLF